MWQFCVTREFSIHNIARISGSNSADRKSKPLVGHSKVYKKCENLLLYDLIDGYTQCGGLRMSQIGFRLKQVISCCVV